MNSSRNFANIFGSVNILQTTTARIKELCLPVLSFHFAKFFSNELMEVKTLTTWEFLARASFPFIQNFYNDVEMSLENAIKPIVAMKNSLFSFKK
eukprot:snap_masked-scaffold_120-processed-gene-0.16-mRNA-1 protein AED:1.00 eAED:1.00 QI:0/-1/0/0/-1/1/1/0/94